MNKSISENTKITYNRLLKQLKEDHNINYENIDNIYDYINDLYYITLNNGLYIKHSSVRMYLTATQYYLKNNNGNSNYMKAIKQEIIKLNNEYIKLSHDNLLIGSQQNNYVEWDTIMDVYYDLMKVKYDSVNKFKLFVILSCYVLLPPRRLNDYSDMYVIQKCDKAIHLTKYAHNYYCKDDKLFIFNNYKTHKTYGTQVVRIPDKLAGIIDNYINYFKFPYYASLFNMTSTCLQHALSNLFKKKLNKNISVNILRHSYISHIKNNGDIAGNERQIAQVMSHSIEMQTDYYKNLSKKKIIIDENNIINML